MPAKMEVVAVVKVAKVKVVEEAVVVVDKQETSSDHEVQNPLLLFLSVVFLKMLLRPL
jgi:hypothetical protein